MDENQNNSITFSGGLPHQSLQKSVKQFMESNKKSNYGSAWNTPRGQKSEVTTFGESCLYWISTKAFKYLCSKWESRITVFIN